MSTATISAPAIEGFIAQIQASREYLARSTSALIEEHSSFSPTPKTMTVAGQITHIALTFDWFLDGAFSPEGFNMDFEEHEKTLAEYPSLTDARELLNKAYERVINKLKTASPEEWSQLLPPGPVMGGAPRFAVISGMVEHAAHHRGALSVYTRMLDLVPPMPYM